MTAIFLLMCALPKRPAQHVKGDETTPAHVKGDETTPAHVKGDETTPAVAEDKEPELVG